MCRDHDPQGQRAFPENHPLFVGVRGDQVAHYLNKSDLILTVGSSLSPLRFSHAIPDAAKKDVIGDTRLTLQALRQEVSDAPPVPAGRPVMWRRK
jgi:thiamine pyrophosphate-dependent acetolactate synthase large subunit-like protein